MVRRYVWRQFLSDHTRRGTLELMPRFCANISLLFTELPLQDRAAAAREAGFEAVEVLFPYDENAAQLGQAIGNAGLPLALINCPPPNYAQPDGPRGFAAVPGEEARFEQAFRRAHRYANALNAERIHIMAGAAAGEEAKTQFIRNLRWAAQAAPAQQLTIEPINRIDMPGYFLNDFDLAFEVIERVGAQNLSLQFDVYHAGRLGLDIWAVWEKVKARVGHIQVAGLPERHEPADGAFSFTRFFARLDEEGYGGWVSGEYHPKGQTERGLGWIRNESA